MIEFVDTDVAWPTFLDKSPFPEARPEIDQRREAHAPVVVAAGQMSAHITTKAGTAIKRKPIMMKKKPKSHQAKTEPHAPVETEQYETRRVEADADDLEAQEAAMEKEIRHSLEMRPEQYDDRDGCCTVQ